jgi:hypothetical protein
VGFLSWLDDQASIQTAAAAPNMLTLECYRVLSVRACAHYSSKWKQMAHRYHSSGHLSILSFKLNKITETESILRDGMFQAKHGTMDNAQNCDSYIDIPSSQTYR